MKKTLAAAIAAAPVLAIALPGVAWATVHTDPCPGEDHIQVWSQVGGPDSRKGQATNHFVCEGDLKGDTGATGATGPAGPSGPAGATGDAGPAGADGASGATGPAGPQGPTGASGATGPQGPAGLAGADGATGPVGPVGPQGNSAFIYSLELNENQSEFFCDGNGGTVIQYGVLSSGQEPGAVVVCNGADGVAGPAGPAGLNGEEGARGPAGKTVIVKADGTQETVDGLPSTGGNGNDTWMLVGIGAGILAFGATTLWILRKEN